MERLEKIKKLIDKGFTCDISTGKVYGVRGLEVNKKNGPYIHLTFYHDKKLYYVLAHHFVWFFANGEVIDCIDHINGIKNDNRIENLRDITHQKNCFNKKIVKGYSKNGKGFQAQISLDYKHINLGTFNTEEEAHQTYLDAKKIYHII
jgi:hypothetical protein